MSDNVLLINNNNNNNVTVPDEVIVDAIKNHANIFNNINATETYDSILNNISDSTRFVFLENLHMVRRILSISIQYNEIIDGKERI